MTDFRHGDLIKPAGTLLSVAADERNCRSVIEQGHAVFHLPVLDLQAFCNIAYIDLFHCLIM